MDPTGYSGGEAAAAGIIGVIAFIIYVAIFVLMIVSAWKIFVKAGVEGWKAIIPIYNVVCMLEIIGKPAWWVILLFIPFANIVISVIMAIELAKVFGKGGGFAVGLIILPFIFYPVLAFSDAQYVGPAGGEGDVVSA